MLNQVRLAGWLAVLTLAVSGAARAAIPPAPGVVNYIEGSASIDGQSVTSKDIGRAQVNQNQILATGQGKAEMLLTPGVLLRAAANTQVRIGFAESHRHPGGSAQRRGIGGSHRFAQRK